MKRHDFPIFIKLKGMGNQLSNKYGNINSFVYEGQSKITEPYLITFELSKMDIYLDDISLKLYVIYLIT